MSTALLDPASTVQQPQTAVAMREQKAPMPMVSRGITFENFESLWRFAGVVSKSGLAPKGIQTPEAIAIAVQMALEVGLSPMAGLQNIAVINGRPSIWGDAQLAIVRASGELLAFEESETNNQLDPIFRELCLEDDPAKRKTLRIQLAKSQSSINRSAEDFGVTVFVHRRGFEPMFARFTVADAKTAGLWTKEGPWRNYPARMLKHRARSFALRDQFGDALKGMLSAEEASDLPPSDPVRNAKPTFAVVTELQPEQQQAQAEPTVQVPETPLDKILARIATGELTEAEIIGLGVRKQWFAPVESLASLPPDKLESLLGNWDFVAAQISIDRKGAK